MDPCAAVCALVPDRTALSATPAPAPAPAPALAGAQSARVGDAAALITEGKMLEWEAGRLRRELRGLRVLAARLRGEPAPAPEALGADLSPEGQSADTAALKEANAARRAANARLVRDLRGMEALVHKLTGKAEDEGVQRSWRGPVVRGVVRAMPKDGNCLFHSLASGLGRGATAEAVRDWVCDFIERSPDEVLAGRPLRDWTLWESGQSCAEYAATMRSNGEWGGPLEMAVCSHMLGVNIHVYQEVPSGGHQRLVAFDVEGKKVGPGTHVVNVAFQPGHYDGFEVQGPWGH